MPSPFPGMDPYLEHPTRWPGFHNLLIADLHHDLAPRLRPKYVVAIEQRVYLAESSAPARVPDVTIRRHGTPHGSNGANSESGSRHATASQLAGSPGAQVLLVELPVPVEVNEWYLEVRDASTSEVVTVIEVLSPANKTPGRGREEYERKRQEVLGTFTSLVEIDLLRGGQPMPARVQGAPEGALPPGEYRILVARARERPRAALYAFTVRDPIPEIPIPLLPDDGDVIVNLQHLITSLYDTGAYDLVLDYTQPPDPQLTDEDAAWADTLLRDRGLR